MASPKVWLLAIALLTGASPAAAQAVYAGDCARARKLAADLPVSARFNRPYRGMSFWVAAQDGCTGDHVTVYDLSRPRAAAGTVVYDVAWYEVRLTGQGGDCGAPQRTYSGSGRAEFSQSVVEARGVCTLTIRLDYELRNGAGRQWKYNYLVLPQGGERMMAFPLAPKANVTAFFRH